MNRMLKPKSNASKQPGASFTPDELAEFPEVRITRNLTAPQVIRIGSAVMKETAGGRQAFPLLVPLADACGLAVDAENADKEKVAFLMQLIALRLICGMADEARQCRFVDLVRFGGGFPFISGLHERIVQRDHFVTDERALDGLLSELSETAGRLIRDRFTYKFQDLSDYNRHSGSVEPYHFVFIADFPAGFSRERIEKLSRIIQNSRKTGIYVFLSYDRGDTLDAYAGIRDELAGKLVARMPLLSDLHRVSCRLRNIENIEKLNDLFHLKAEGIQAPVPAAAVENLIRQLNETCEAATAKELKEDGIRIPIGKKGHETHFFTLGYDSNVYHALVGGQTGWGKTVLLHTLIVRSMAHYGPEELELWLMDYKEGTEFSVYRNHPNVTYLSVENNLEQGIEILERLQGIIEERGVLFKKENVSAITRYNEEAGRKLPRILLVVDEFQKLLENFKIAGRVNTLLEDVAKRGRAFGIHLLLSTQSLLNSRLEPTTRNQFGLRIVFKIHKSECGKFFDYNNEAPAELDKKGEAIYNTDNGRPKANEKIVVDYIDEEKIAEIIGG